MKQENQIIKFYQNELTGDEIKVKLNIGRDVIYGCLKRNNIKRRSTGHQKGRSSWNKGIKYSEKQKKKLNLEGLKKGRGLFKGQIGIYSKETLEKMKESHIGKIGEKSSNWQGGISFEPYSSEFNKYLKEEIRERDNFICQMPECWIKENGRNHSIHHIDYDKENTNKNNLITLCVSCNGKVNGNRPYWQKLFQNIQIQRGIN